MAFSPDSKFLVTGSYDWTSRLWDPATGRQIGLPLAQEGVVQSLAFSPDGRTLAVGRARSALGPAGVLLWDIPADGRPARRIAPLLAGPHVIVQFSPDGNTLLSATADSFRLWDPATGQPRGPSLFEESEVNAVAFSADNREVLMGCTDGTARLWDVATGKPLGAPMPHARQINVVAFSPDPAGQLILAGCADGSARLWDHATHKPLGPPVLHRRAILAAKFTPDGQSFVTTDDAGQTRVWPVPRSLEGDAQRLALRLQVRTGLHMGLGQTVLRLDPVQWQERRQQLLDLEGSLDSAYTGSVSDRQYHDARAWGAGQDNVPFALQWHLDRLIAASDKEDWLAFARRGRASTLARQFSRADADYAEALRLSSPVEMLRWYRQRTVDCLAAHQWQAALWYLDRVLAAAPNDWRGYADRALALGKLERDKERQADADWAVELGADSYFLMQLGEEHASGGQWDRTAVVCKLATERGPCAFWVWPRCALAALKVHDAAQYRKVCTVAVQQAGQTSGSSIANLAAWTCSLGPSGVADYGPVVALAEQAVKTAGPSDRQAVLNTAGAILYRAGRFQEAIQRLNEGIKVGGGQGEVHDWIFLAMAYHQSGETDQARKFLGLVKKSSYPAQSWTKLELELLRAEAEMLIDGSKPAR
jgi:tetratricopeptide (TPR) repeat protein